MVLKHFFSRSVANNPHKERPRCESEQNPHVELEKQKSEEGETLIHLLAKHIHKNVAYSFALEQII